MEKILDSVQSTFGNPYAIYSVYAEEVNGTRKSNEVKIKITIESNLRSSQSFLGTGYPLTAYMSFDNTEYSIPIKSSNESWSGTAIHRKEKTLKITGLTSSQTTLQNIKFKVVGRNTNESCSLKNTNCSNITISMGHLIPNEIEWTIYERNQNITRANIDNTTFVNRLSIKRFTVDFQLNYDTGVSLGWQKVQIINGNNIFEFINTNIQYYNDNTIVGVSFDISFRNNQLYIDTNNKAPIKIKVFDTLGGIGESGVLYYDIIPYILPTIIDTNSYAERVDATSGEIKLNLNGIIYSDEIGNIDQTNYKPKIEYKFWNVEDSEPLTYGNEISNFKLTEDLTFQSGKNYYTYVYLPSWYKYEYQLAEVTVGDTIPPNTYYEETNNITLSNNTFNLENFIIGSDDETSQDYFKPEESYRIKFKVSDWFANTESNEFQITVGEAIWGEYKDKVDFKKITIDKESIITIEEYEEYTGATASGSNDTITYNIAKTGYTPIAVAGVYCSGNRTSYINVYAFYINSSTEAKVTFKNTHPSESLVANNSKIKIWVAYIKN